MAEKKKDVTESTEIDVVLLLQEYSRSDRS